MTVYLMNIGVWPGGIAIRRVCWLVCLLTPGDMAQTVLSQVTSSQWRVWTLH